MPLVSYGSAYAGIRSRSLKIRAAESFAFAKSGAEEAARPSWFPPKMIAEKIRKTEARFNPFQAQESLPCSYPSSCSPTRYAPKAKVHENAKNKTDCETPYMRP